MSVGTLPQGNDALEVLERRFGRGILQAQTTCDNILTIWLKAKDLLAVLQFLKHKIERPYNMLYDLSAIDERTRRQRHDQPPSAFTAVYHLLSFTRNADIRLKVALGESRPELPSVTSLWPSANWYERELWDMFGVRFKGHPNLRRILLPPTWVGHPLRKDHPARATELGRYRLSEEEAEVEQEAMRFRPEEWGMQRNHGDTDFMFLNLGPNHPSVHGVFRIILQLDGEKIVDTVPDIGFHHRGAEKMGERQTWHSFIPYTDRIDYLGGVMNNFPYVLTVEKLAGIEVPDRVKLIRIMTAELFRLASHLVFLGTMAQDVGQMSPVFYMFSDRERVFGIIEAICGGRMHPSWFRIGGVAQDLPQGWEELVRDFLSYFRPRLEEYEKLVLRNRLFRSRTVGVGRFTLDQAIDWGATGPMLRACGLEWDLRKKRPYSGYDELEFDIPTGSSGDSYDRSAVRLEEMRQSTRIIEQCLERMPEGPYKSDHPLTTPPPKEHTLHDIETLISHFLGVSWGPVIPAGEACVAIEATKGINSYYLISDGGNIPYRVRIRTPSFAHLQMIPMMCRGQMVADLIATLGSIDFVMADVDR